MRGRIMSAFALALGIVGTVVSVTAIVLAACSFGSRRASHCRSINK